MIIDNSKFDFSLNDTSELRKLILENPDYASAFVGVSYDNRAVYDYDKMVDFLMNKDGMTDIEAIEFIEYNTIRSLSYYGNSTPIIIYNLD